MINTQYINLNMTPSGVMPVLYCSQYDIGRPLGVVVYNGGEAVDLDSYTCTIEATRTDGTAITAAVTTSGNIGAFVTTATMTNQADKYPAKLVLFDSNSRRVASLAFVMVVTERTMDENAESIQEDESLYQQFTGTVQTIIAEIRANLAAEVTRATAAEASLQSALSAETSARQSADQTLTANLASEVSARQTADNALRSNIGAESSARTAADAVLQAEIDELVAPSGEVPSAAEVQNIRVGADGITYPSAGDAVRANDNEIKYPMISNFIDNNAIDILLWCKKVNNPGQQGATYTWNAEGTVCTINTNGATTGLSVNNLFMNANAFPKGIGAGSKLRIMPLNVSENIAIHIFVSTDGASFPSTPAIATKNRVDFMIPSNATGIFIRLAMGSGTTASNVAVSPRILTDVLTNEELQDLLESGFIPRGALADGTDFNAISDNGYWFTTSSHTYQNSPLPSGIPGIVISYIYNDSLKAQVVYSVAVNQPNVWIRSCVLGNWFAWKEMKDYGAFSTKGDIPNGTDFDTLTDSGIWAVIYNYAYTNNPMPSGYAGTLLCFKVASTMTLQMVVELTNVAKMYVRTYIAATGWRPWTTIQGGNTYNNTYVTQNYENTYNITATPTITTDTNNYLASTNDDTDRTGDIQTMLNMTGVCRLGPGVFYTTGVEVPNYGALIGSGKKTQLILAASVTNGYAVKLKTYSTVRDICILGATSAITPSSTVGTRHGILFEGTADAQSNPQTFYRSYVTGCLIRNFAGGGITCYNTGLSPAASLVVSDCQIAVCDAGINIPYFSEFHRITNVTAQECYYGCIDNGGNNNFANCDFSMNKMALLIDNSTNQSRNNTHGTFSACTFHHSDNTYSGGSIVSVGTAIRILGAIAGEIFTGCQIGYGNLEIDDSIGIRFVGCNFLRMTALQITDSPLVAFSDCNFWDANSSPLTQSGNTTLKFSECYLMNGTAFNPMA